jgi:predicted ester cyclase
VSYYLIYQLLIDQMFFIQKDSTMNRKINRHRARAIGAGTLGFAAVVSLTVGISPSSAKSVSKTSKSQNSEVATLKAQIAAYVKSDETVAANLKTFDTLDFDVYSNQKWERLGESHAPDVKVYYPDGHTTEGLDAHIAELKQTFFFAPDTRIKEHPIKLGSGNMTAVTGVFEGTFTKPLPDGKGGIIPATGKAFKVQMATVSIWKDGRIIEEHLYLDNATFFKQIGLG